MVTTCTFSPTVAILKEPALPFGIYTLFSPASGGSPFLLGPRASWEQRSKLRCGQSTQGHAQGSVTASGWKQAELQVGSNACWAGSGWADEAATRIKEGTAMPYLPPACFSKVSGKTELSKGKLAGWSHLCF